MKFIKTKLEGLYIIEPELKIDGRGYFTTIFGEDELKKEGINFKIVQVNRSLTIKKGSVRGMHLQKEPMAQAKIVQCIKGRLYDVALDLRPGSKTYGRWEAVELKEDDPRMFLIPKGFAHGFQTLTKNCEMQYFMSEFYSPKDEAGVRWDDPAFNIKWPLKISNLSEKDKNWPLVKAIK
ncbi:MAG: dTDP-4-dehydrorhamnose 3,5-epimerase [bacterium]|nr:dTDP-4-dehydrorhamnose 3,5-epimerase [bacterium]